VIIVWIINKENNMNFDIIKKIEGEKMLKKENLEFLLSRAMQSNADFAEIFEEETTNESISMLNGNVEDVNKVLRYDCIKMFNLSMDILMN
jgi:hypothetical protein